MKKCLYTVLLLCFLCVVATGCSGENNPNNIDMDFTRMSGTMVYAAVVEMLQSPNEHLGKTVKARGEYMPFFFEPTGLYYHYIVIEGPPGCCPVRLEFILDGDYVFPDDYPDEDTAIEIIGIFSSYEELDQTWHYLAIDEIIILEAS